MREASFGRYRLLELLGQGGMGQVYRAFDIATDRVVALKVLRSEASDDTAFQQRFRRESHTAAGLTDPHVVPIHGYGEIDGRLYLDMRLIEGRDLGHVLSETGQPLDPARAVHYVEQVAEALDAAHTAGLVHRDVKPSNILITPRDFVYLIDFGIAQAVNATRLTSTGSAIGTFAYMAPERISVGQNEPRSDVYSLACVLHECLTGQPPFGGDSVEQQIAAHLMTAPPRPSETRQGVPVGFDAVVAKGMAKDPDARYQTALELADARQALNASSPRPDSSAAQAPTHIAEYQRQRNIVPWILAAVAATVVAAIISVILFAGNSSDHKPRPTTATGVPSSPPTPTAERTTTSTQAEAGALPPFNPPADLGANCSYSATPSEPAAKAVTPPMSGRVPTDPATVSLSLTTNQGTLGLQLDNGRAPCTVNNFVSLAQKGYYDKTSCHRLTTGPGLFVLQCGDPKGDGSGGPGYQFNDEYPSNQYLPDDPARNQPLVYPRGTLAMANSRPNTNGSQFFIVYQDSQLPPNYTVFGKVDDKDMGVLDKIAGAGTVDGSTDGRPKTDVLITSARLD